MTELRSKKTPVVIVLLVIVTIGFVAYRTYAKNHGLILPERAIAALFKSGSANAELPEPAGTIRINYEAKGMIGAYRSQLIKSDSESMTAFDVTGTEKWSVPFKAVGSVLTKTAGPYFMAADVGGRQIVVLEGDKERARMTLPFTVKNADISTSGKIVVVHDDTNNNNAVTVYDINQKKVFTRYMVDSTIVSAKITGNGKYIFVYSVNINDNIIDTIFEYIDMNGETVGQPVHKQDTLFPCVEALGNEGAAAINDTLVLFFSPNETEAVSQTDLGRGNILRYNVWNDKSIMLAVRGSSTTDIRAVGQNGKDVINFKIEGEVDAMASQDGTIALAKGNELTVTGDSGKVLMQGRLNSDIVSLVFISSGTLAAVTNNSIDIFRI